jgi:O-antigen/teichoic acid export membrane protein
VGHPLTEWAVRVEAETDIDEQALGGQVQRAFSWSLINSVIRRIWTFVLGIVLARLLVPADFGVYAIALAALAILQSMNDLGTAIAVIRWQGDPARASRTATTISIVGSIVMYGMVYLLAPVVANQLDTPQTIPVLRLLTFAVVLDGFSGIPNALMERALQQNRRLVADMLAIVANAVVAVSLAAAGHGAWALAWGIIVGNAVATVIIIVLAPARPLPGWNTDDARSLLAVGMPLAGASLLVFAMLNLDYLVLGSIVASTALGLYLLAFNVSSWPSNLLTVAVRSVSIPAFSQLASNPQRLNARFVEILQVLMIGTLPVAVMLGALGSRLIAIVYGERWVPAAVALPFLASLSVARVGLDFCYDYLVAIGRTRAVMWLQALWLAALAPALVIGARVSGIRGAAIAHLVVAVALVGPAFGFTLRRAGLGTGPLLKALRWPVAGTVAMIGSVVIVDQTVVSDVWALLLGGVVGTFVYVSVAMRWWRGRVALTELTTLLRGQSTEA